ncbi:MAG TPA: aldo/keto reductase [Solirubrobacteraceae bacterium]
MAAAFRDLELGEGNIGLGLAALGRPGYINLGHGGDFAGHTDVESMQERAHDVLDAAYDAGVRYFDAARSYGRAEEFLATWLALRGLGPDEVTVGSKWGYRYTAGWRIDAKVHEVKDLSLPHLEHQYEESREWLGTELRLYQIHSATLDSGVLDDPAVMEELSRLRANGLLVGFTVTGPQQRETIERALQVGEFDTVQATWNLMERSAQPALEAAHRQGLGVIIKEAVANGRLTPRGDTPLLTEVARELDTTEDAVALSAASHQPWVDVALSGASTVEMLRSNLTAREFTLDSEVLDRLDALREDPGTYWETRSDLSWN